MNCDLACTRILPRSYGAASGTHVMQSKYKQSHVAWQDEPWHRICCGFLLLSAKQEQLRSSTVRSAERERLSNSNAVTANRKPVSQSNQRYPPNALKNY